MRDASRPQEYELKLTIYAALLEHQDGASRQAADRAISSALNTYAGGRRLFHHTPVHVSWALHWRTVVRPTPQELCVRFIRKDLLLAKGEGGLFRLDSTFSSGLQREIATVWLPREDLLSARGYKPDTRSVTFARTVAHEFGHAQGLGDSENLTSIMFKRQLTPAQTRRIKQRWTDDELRGALQHLFQPGTLPPWLKS